MRVMRFDERAADYERHATPQARVTARFAAFLSPTTETVLELGAGTGLLTRDLLARGFRIVASDLSEAMIETGRHAAPEARWIRLDAFSGPFPAHRRIVSANLLQWADSPAAACIRLRDMLPPGGVTAHAVLVRPTLAELDGLVAGAPPVRWYDASEWLAAAHAAGLRVTRREDVLFRERYADAATLLADLHGTGAVSGKPLHGPGRLRTLLREYDAKNATPDGGVAATWAALFFEAVRD